MKPLIGLTSYLVDQAEFGKERERGLPGQDMLMSSMDYSRSVEKSGGIPLNIPAILSDDYIYEVVNRIDGLILTGGGDIHPKFYDQSVEIGFGKLEKYRDEFEMKVLKAAIEKGIPIMGICRGFQLINVYFGGTLIQDLNTRLSTIVEHVGIMLPRYDILHRVDFTDGSFLNEIFQVESIDVNSFHHQALDKLGEGIEIVAISEDGIPEGLIHKDYSKIFAVQWHPEMMSEVHKEQYKLFEHLIQMSMGE